MLIGKFLQSIPRYETLFWILKLPKKRWRRKINERGSKNIDIEISTRSKRLRNFVQLGYHFVICGLIFFGNKVPLTKRLWIGKL